MGNNRPLPTKCWENFLISKGYYHSHTSASHHIWTKKGTSRPIPVWGSKKEIPADHMRTSARTIGCTIKDVYDWAETNC